MRTRCGIVAMVALGLLLTAATAPAVVFVWNGSGANDNWTTNANWAGGVAPGSVNTDDVQMAGAVRPTPVVDTNNPWVLNSLIFNPGTAAFTLSGNPLAFQGSSSTTIRNNSGNTQTIGNEVRINAGGARQPNAASAPLIFNGPLVLNASVLFRGGQNVTLNGLVSGGGSLSRTDFGTVFITNNANTYTGSTSISHGIFDFASIANIGVPSAIGAGSAIYLSQTNWYPSDTGTLRYAGPTASTNRTVYMRANNNSIPIPGNPSGRPTIEVTNPGTTLTFNSNFPYAGGSSAGWFWRLRGAGSGVINGNITTTGAGLVKDGTGTWTLAGVNTYGASGFSPSTEVNAGTLLVNGTNTASAANVNSGGTLGGTGSIQALVTVNSGGLLSPGPGVDLIDTIGVGGGGLGFDLLAGGTLEIDATTPGPLGIPGTDYDLVAVTGSASLAGTVLLDTLAFSPNVGDFFDILTATGTIDTTGLTVSASTPLPGGAWWAAMVLPGAAGGQFLRLTAMPEPTTLTLLALGGIGLLRRRRRRRQRV